MLSKLWEFRALRANRRLVAAELEALRLRKLRKSVRRTADQVPFYRSLWQSEGVSPKDLGRLEDLSRWPIVTKQQLQRAGIEALAGGRGVADGITLRTSGSTGDALEVRLTPSEHRTRLLIEFRSLMAMGLRPSDRLAIVGPVHERSLRLHERLGLFRTEVLTMDLSVEQQIEELERFQPTFLWAYPDCLLDLLQAVDQRLSRVIRPRAVITSAAVLPEPVAEKVVADLGCELFNSYASVETGRLAAECPAHRGLHVNADHVILELVREDWMRAEDPSCVVVTTLNAAQMPFIRYRLGDLSRPVSGACPCGCAFPRIEAPIGRSDDAMVLPDGSILGAWRLMAIVRGFREVERFRFIQHARERLELGVVVRGQWGDGRRRELRRQLQAQIGEGVEVEIRRVERLEPAGTKFRTFFSEVS